MTSSESERAPMRVRAWAIGAPVFGALWVLAPTVAWALSTSPDWWQIALVAVGIPSFAALFLVSVMTELPVWRPLIGMLLIAVVLTIAVYEQFAWLFVWAGSAASVRLAGPMNAVALVAITALAAGAFAISAPDAGAFWGILSAIATIGVMWLLIGGLLRTNRALREARAELAELAVAEERLRFARDLHDLLGHDLSLIALKAELAGRLLPGRVDDAAREVEQIRELTRSALGQVREAVDGYRQPSLGSEIAGAKVALEAAGISLSVHGLNGMVDPAVEPVLAWAVREGATNAIRHSGARHAEITVRPGPGGTELEFSDDGRGAGGVDRGGHGLTGLRERAQSVGGTVEAGAGSHGGFRVTVRVP